MKKTFALLVVMLFAVVNIAIAQEEPDYLCFEVKAGTTVSLEKGGRSNPNIQYSFDKKKWTNFVKLTAEEDCKIYFKGSKSN
jgi:hypothetical protein